VHSKAAGASLVYRTGTKTKLFNKGKKKLKTKIGYAQKSR